MNRQLIIESFRLAIKNNRNIYTALFGNDIIPNNIEDTVLSLSSLDYVDLLIEIEDSLNIEISDKYMNLNNITIGELVKRIEKNV